MRREFRVGREHDDALRRLERFAIVLDVPDARRRVLRLPDCGRGGVEVELVGRRVCAQQGGEIDFVEALVLEEPEEGCGGGVDVWEEAVGGGRGGVFAADEGFDLRAAGAGDDGVVAREDWAD